MSGSLASAVEGRTARFRTAWRLEVRRTASALAFALATAFFTCAAAGVAFFSLMLAFWDTHRVLVAALGAAGLAILAVIGLLLLRACTRPSNR